MQGVRVYVDDLLIWGTDKADHDQRLRSALRTAQSAGFMFNAQKCQFGVQKMECLGDIIRDKRIPKSGLSRQSSADAKAP